MTILPTKDAIVRFDENEDRLNTFINSYGTYSTNSGLPTVETLPSFIQRNTAALNLLTATNVKGAWTSSTVYSVWDEVQYSGTWYRCVVAHTSTGTFDSSKWRISQGITSGQLSPSSGASLVGFAQAGTGAVQRDLQSKNRDIVNVADYGAVVGTDATNAIKQAVAAHLTVHIDGEYLLSDEISLRSNQTIVMTASSKLTQTVSNKNIFKAVSKDNVWIHCNGAVLYGKGDWSASWTGNSGHEDKVVQFIGCTRSGISFPTIKNGASAGISIVGGDGIKLIAPHIEGTHNYSTPLPSEANFQSGIYITDNITYGKASNVLIIAPDISGVAIGILRENQGSTLLEDASLVIANPSIHDIPGQHAFYIQGGLVSVSNPVLANINLSGFKVQSADANQNINGFTCLGVSAKSVKSNIFEIATIGTGSISNVNLSAVGHTCGTGVSLNGKIKNVNVDVELTNSTAYGAYIFGDGGKDFDIKIKSNVCDLEGVLVAATNLKGLKLYPTLRNCNNSNDPTMCGIRVASASAEVEIFNPDITDSNNRMVYGLFNSVYGSVIKVRGSVKITGAKDTAVRLTGLITEWPTEVILQGLNGEILGSSGLSSSQPIVLKATSSSSTNVPLWYQSEFPDSSAVLVKADIVGKFRDSSQRRTLSISRLFYRNGGNVIAEGATSVAFDSASSGFTGQYSLQSDGATGAVIVVNSGGSATIDWTVKVSITKTL